MTNDFNNDSLLELYLYESTSLLDAMDDILLKAEADGNLTSENINEIFRIMHTIKGSSLMMGYSVISDVAHSAEGLFSAVRDSFPDVQFFDELFDLVLAVSDFLKTEVTKLQEGKVLETGALPLTSQVKGLTEKMRGGEQEAPSLDLGRILGEPQGASVPEAPGNGPIPDELAADISKFIENASADADAPAPGEKETYYLHIHFNEGSKMENIRAFMLVNKLAEKGAVDRTLPANPENDPDATAFIVERGFYVSFSTSLFREQIETLIKGTLSVETVSFLRRFPDEADAPAKAPGPPKPELRPRPLAPHETEARTPEAKIPGARTPEAQIPEARTPEAKIPGARTPEAKIPETRTPEARIPEARIPEAKTPETQRRTEMQRPVFSGAQQSGLRPPLKPGRPVFFDVTRPIRKEPAAPSKMWQPHEEPGTQRPFEGPQEDLHAYPHEDLHAYPHEDLHAYPHEDLSARPQEDLHARPHEELPARTQEELHARPPREQKPHMPPEAPQIQEPLESRSGNIISVELKKLDTLLDLVGEIAINESFVTENPELSGLELTNFRKAARHLDKLTGELQDSVLSIRMLPVSSMFQRMRRIVRDMGKNLGKEADLILVGEMTEVDKTILDTLADPVMHLVRNAMDHGIETPEKRVAAGKLASGHIILSAQTSGSDVIVSVSDDGMGLDRNMILQKARERGLLKKPESEYTEKEAYSLLMAPGFSTKGYASEYSGRGVGLDIVRNNIERIGGYVSIESRQGIGVNILMKIPLTLAIIPCIEITVGSGVYAIPVSNIREAFKADAGQLVTDPSGMEMIMLRGNAYRVIRLYERFGNTDAVEDVNEGILVLVEAGDRRACLLADRLVGKFQVVVKPMPPYLRRLGVTRSGISGCTIMGDGNISLIVNVQDLID
ncbi:MAG: chemotaxis protein CheW [Clostridiales bacterium]|nr:chemotaxis protein CheW [Clostridiales bacterium]